jgi:hypothetical protein
MMQSEMQRAGNRGREISTINFLIWQIFVPDIRDFSLEAHKAARAVPHTPIFIPILPIWFDKFLHYQVFPSFRMASA